MSNGRGAASPMSASKSKTQAFDPRASIVFAGPIRDAFGNDRRELFEDEAQWRLVFQSETVTEGEAPSAILAPGQAPTHQRSITLHVPMYEVTQVRNGRACVLFVPVEQVRAVRFPKVPVQFTNDDGKVVQVQLLDPHEAAAMKRAAEKDAELVKGEPAPAEH